MMRNFINISSGLFPPVVSALVGLALTPFVLLHLGIEAYAYWPLCNSLTLYATFLTISISTGLRRHTAYALERGEIEEARNYFNTGLAMMFAFSILLLLISIFLSTRLSFLININDNFYDDVQLMFLFIALSASIDVLTPVFFIGVYASNHLYIEKLGRTLAPIIRLLFIYFAFIFWVPSLRLLGISATVSTFIILIISIMTFYQYLPIMGIDLKKYVTLKAMRSLSSFGGWILSVAVGDYAFRSLHLILAIRYIGTVETGRYGIVLQVISVIMTGTAHIGYVLSRKLITPVSQNNYTEAQKILTRYYSLTMCVLALPAAILFVHADTLFMLWLGKAGEGISSLMRISIVATFIAEPISMVNSLLLASKRVVNNGISTLFMAPILFVLSFLLIKGFGWGVGSIAIASGLAVFLRNLSLSIEASRWCSLRLKNFAYGLCVGILALAAVVGSVYARMRLSSLSLIISLSVDVVLSCSVWAIVLWILSKDSRDLTRQMIGSIMLKRAVKNIS